MRGLRNHRRNNPSHRRGSVGDLAVVGLCLLCLLSFIPAAVLYSRESARDQHRRRSMQQVGTAVQAYHQIWNTYPQGGIRQFPHGQ